MRWGCAKLLEKVPEGAYIPGYGYMDTNGDGVKDVGFFPDSESANEAKKDLTEEDLKNVSTQIIDDKSPIMFSEGDHGHILRTSQVQANWEWIEPKYYYTPISVRDININPNLKQNKFWAE